jgi:hypothetical protein
LLDLLDLQLRVMIKPNIRIIMDELFFEGIFVCKRFKNRI